MKFGLLKIDTRIHNNFDCLCFMKKLCESGYYINTYFTAKNQAEYLDSLPWLKKCDLIFVIGQREEFLKLSASTIALTENCFEIDSFLYIFLDNVYDIAAVEQKIKLYHEKFRIQLSLFRIFSEESQDNMQFIKTLNDLAKKERVLFSYNMYGNYLDLFVRYKKETNITGINAQILNRFYRNIFATKFKSLSELIHMQFSEKKLSLKIAESFTGGGVSAAIVEYPGASDFLLEALTVYSVQSKIKRLSVREKTLQEHSAVSGETAKEMVRGLLKSGCDVAIATTGNAGPTTDLLNRTKNACFIAIGTQERTDVFAFSFSGDRSAVIDSGIQSALFLLFQRITSEKMRE